MTKQDGDSATAGTAVDASVAAAAAAAGAEPADDAEHDVDASARQAGAELFT